MSKALLLSSEEEQLERFESLLPVRQGQTLALTAVCAIQGYLAHKKTPTS